MNGDIPKLQFSKFSPDRTEQYVIRTDSWEELEDLKKKVISAIPKANAFPDDIGSPTATPPEQVQPSVPVCSVHGTPMKYIAAGVSKAGKRYGAFYSCSVQENGVYCRETKKA